MVKKKELSKTKEGFGVSGFTLGILSIVFANIIGFVFSIIGFTLCIIQQKKYPMKIAKTGIILNIIGFVLSITITFILSLNPNLI